MHELGALVSSVADPMSDPALLEPLKSMARRLWLGWGHTQMIEDGNREMRDRETRDTTNTSMKILKQWGVLRTRGLMELHKREEIVADVADPDLATAAPISPNMFSARGHHMSIDGLRITDRMDWPAFTAQSAQVLSAQRRWMQYCLENDCWEVAGRCWLSMLLPQGVVVEHAGRFYISLAICAFSQSCAWKLSESSRTSALMFFAS